MTTSLSNSYSSQRRDNRFTELTLKLKSGINHKFVFEEQDQRWIIVSRCPRGSGPCHDPGHPEDDGMTAVLVPALRAYTVVEK